MRRFLAIAAMAAGVSAVWGGFGAGAVADEQVVACQSKDYKRRVCSIDQNATEVELRRQFSGAECINERTWGARVGEIWVDRGCSAEFVVYTESRSRRQEGERVVCASKDYRRAECAISDRVREVELVRRTSGAPCVYGQSWGFTRGSLWVDRGCSGEFEVATTDSGRGGARRRSDDDDRGRPSVDRFLAERSAVRACRRYGEDHPDKMGANWVEANPQETFKAEAQGRRGDEYTVVGRFKTFNRGREGTARGRCVVNNDRVVGFNAN